MLQIGLMRQWDREGERAMRDLGRVFGGVLVCFGCCVVYLLYELMPVQSDVCPV